MMSETGKEAGFSKHNKPDLSGGSPTGNVNADIAAYLKLKRMKLKILKTKL